MSQHVSFFSQAEVLDSFSEKLFSPDKALDDLKLLPLAVVALQVAAQILHVIFRQIRLRIRKPTNPETDLGDTEAHNTRTPIVDHIQRAGGYTIFGMLVARLIATTSLLVLSAETLRKCAESEACTDTSSLLRNCPEYGLTASLLYATVMAFLMVASNTYASIAGGCNIVTLLTVLGVYVYRDIYPLATYVQQPADREEGNVIWIKIAILTMTTIVLPLFTPRRYVPINSKDTVPVDNPEQTVSWISRLTFSHIDSIISLARKVPHLSYTQLPQLMFDDSAKYQTEKAFLRIEPSRVTGRHVFFGLMRHFQQEYILYTITMLIQCFMSFVAPTGIKQTLHYLETGGAGSTVRPWVWISLLLIGPLLGSITQHWCLYIETKIRVRLQAVLTQVVFEHSLRIRLKAETAKNENSDAPGSSAATLNDSQSKASQPENDQASEEHPAQESALNSASSDSTRGNIQEPATPKGVDSAPAAKNDSEKAGNLIGKINNLVTSDLDNMADGVDYLSLVIRVPLQITLCMVFLYQILGWSSFVGFASTISFFPLGGYVGKKMQDVQTTRMEKTDARVQKISEAINAMRMIKLFGWEGKITKRLDQSREVELGWLWKTKIFILLSSLISYVAPMVSMLLTYATYTVVMKKELNASIIFSSIAVFDILIEQLNRLVWQTSMIISAKVSLDRLNDFIHDTEVLDHYSIEKKQPLQLIPSEDQSEEIGFRNAVFAWSASEKDGALTPRSQSFRLHIEDEILFKRNSINLIVGPTGSGKTSMLMALLGEMHFTPSSADSWYNLPRKGGVAYAAQESWVQNATIRENIIFESPYDEERYQKVLRQCALEPDLKLFEAGDQTEVGERGLTLSGGQKARVTLARAIYSSAGIILLDDVFAALDVHTSTWIVNQCFRGDLIKGRTILLVTHNMALVGSIAHFIVSIGLDGGIRSQSNDINTVLSADPVLASEVEHDKELADKSLDQAPAAAAATGKLTVPEEIAEGHITWKSMKLILSALGGNDPIFFFVVILLGAWVEQLFQTSQPWFLGVWGAQYEKRNPSEVSLVFYLSTFAALLLGNFGTYTILNFYYYYRSIGASRTIHDRLINSVFGTTLRWLDQTPTSRILARCTQDIRTIDNQIADSMMWVLVQIFGASIKLFVLAYLTPIFLFPGVAIGLLGIFIGNLYLKAQLSVKREMSNARSPMLSHFSAAIHGLVSLRAYGAEQAFKNESYKRIDHYSRTARISWDLNRWVGFRIDALGATFTTALAAYLIYGPPTTASNTGFSLDLAVTFSVNIFWLIRIFNLLEVQSNSLERIQDYLDIEHEPSPTESGKPPASWPTSGALRVEKLNARYSPSGPNVLKDLTFSIAPGERIGVVGRTGSGKSSLTLALLRCILTEGKVYYDGLPVDGINLDTLRSNITIIPQTPELLSGTLRENLDPFDENDDATLNNALRSSGLLSLQKEGETITLDTQISGGGSNLSVGQRQIIALARAIVRRSKLLILDEATSAVDYKTDAVIQETLRTEIGSDVTVITIAHRLQTIMDADRILVLDSGNLAEFDTPQNLLKNEKGILRALVDGSGDKQNLVALADK